MAHYPNKKTLAKFENSLREDEKCPATVQKYLRDVRAFLAGLAPRQPVDKQLVIRYKQQLVGRYAAATVNGKLASLNSFFKRVGWYDCVVRSLKVQKEAFRAQERELTRQEYYRLLDAAQARGDRRLWLLMQTICATGIRVSELPFITVAAVRSGRARVSLKGKTRTVLLPPALCSRLLQYIRARGLQSGSVFRTRTGRPVDRCSVFRAMKALCGPAGVSSRKVFPHNLRHLFACTYYQAEKDIARLADLLGHSSVNTTRIYLTKSGAEQARSLGRLGLVP